MVEMYEWCHMCEDDEAPAPGAWTIVPPVQRERFINGGDAIYMFLGGGRYWKMERGSQELRQDCRTYHFFQHRGSGHVVCIREFIQSTFVCNVELAFRQTPPSGCVEFIARSLSGECVGTVSLDVWQRLSVKGLEVRLREILSDKVPPHVPIRLIFPGSLLLPMRFALWAPAALHSPVRGRLDIRIRRKSGRALVRWMHFLHSLRRGKPVSPHVFLRSIAQP